MRTLSKVALLTALPAAIAAAICISTAMAQQPATNAPPSFRVPLVRDMELLDQVKALTARVTDLETRNADLTKKVASLEARLAALETKVPALRR